MKALTFRFLLFVLLALGLNTMIYGLLPENWENIRLERKISLLEDDYADSVTLIFIGSSRIYRSFNPDVVESRLLEYGIQQRIFNLGFSALLPLEQDFVINRILSNDYPLLDYVIIEFQSYIRQDDDNLYTARNNYIFTIEAFTKYCRWILDEQLSWQSKLDYIYGAGLSLVEKVLSIGYIFDVGEYLHLAQREPDFGLRGHVPLNVDKLVNTKSSYYKRHRTLADDTLYIRRNMDAVSSLYKAPDAPYNQRVLEYYCDLISELNAKGVKVIYLVPPRSYTSPDFVSMQRRLPQSNVINFNNLGQIPHLAQYRYWADRGHLEESGSVLISEMFADSLVQIMRPR